MQTLNADEEEPRPDGLAEAMLADLHARQAVGLSDLLNQRLNEDETKPPGYGTLAVTYEWRMYDSPPARAYVRAWCLTDSKWMTFTLKIDPRYGRHRNQHTRGEYATIYEGKMVQCWECRDCAQWVVK